MKKIGLLLLIVFGLGVLKFLWNSNTNAAQIESIKSRKLELLAENEYALPYQQTCMDVCRTVPETTPEMEEDLVQVGDVPINQAYEEQDSVYEQNYSPLIHGGSWAFRRTGRRSSSKCMQSYKDAGVAIVIICKDRWKQVNATLQYLIPLLQKQHLCFRLFVVEQRQPDYFNRGMLFNVGFMEAIERFRFRCVIFHDADLSPINDLNPYGCDSLSENTAVHLGVALDDRNFTLRYTRLVGGVLKISARRFVQLNGFSNMYWGWGQEDDDFERRMRSVGMGYVHIPITIARYHVIKHDSVPKDKIKEHRFLLKSAAFRTVFDGLSSLRYSVIESKEKPLYTHIVVDLYGFKNFSASYL